MVEVLRRSDASVGCLHEIRELLFAAFEDFTEEDWFHTLGGVHVVVRENGGLVSHAAVVPREIHVGERAFRAGYVEGVVTTPGHRRRGHGSAAMRALGDVLRNEFELGVLSTGAHDFYTHLGWERWRGPTFVRDGDELRRTEDEDDGVMVLRFGASAYIDLAAPISCEARPGDDW